ncbi:MAG: methyltransferase domain-containing protein [Chloroflexia bacterium]|nr:methyltransferase domain-containing protein [Chloroflexia bacterium]
MSAFVVEPALRGGSLPFDRAAPLYDRTRGFPPGVAERVAAGICRLAGLGPGAALLDLGVGTGRLALPLAARGLRVTGIDLSRPMLEALRAKEGPGRLPLVEADVVHLPFAGGAFQAVLAVYLFHLVGGWRAALAEARRVLAPGGCFLLGWVRWGTPNPFEEVMGRWREIVVSMGGRVSWPGQSEPERLRRALRELGLQPQQAADAAVWSGRACPAQVLEHVAERAFSDSWRVPEDLHQRSLQKLREWLRRRYEDPGQMVEAQHAFQLAVLEKT